MNITEVILSRGRDAASAVLYCDTVLTYGELREKVAQVARHLLTRGHAKGDRIGIFSENNPFFVTAYLGIIKAGLVAVPLQTELTAEGFDQIGLEAGLREVFVSKRFRNRLRPWAERIGVALAAEGEWEAGSVKCGVRSGGRSLLVPLPSDGREGEHSSVIARLSDDGGGGPEIEPARDLAALMFTSGSTGAPKGVMVSHRNIECNTRDIVSYMGLGPEDRAMVVLPFHYCFGLSLLHSLLLAGGAVVLNNVFRLYPEVMLRELRHRDCTGLAGVPSTYQILLRKSRFRQPEFPRLRWFQQAGGKLPNPCIREILRAFPQVRYFLMYGQTEGTARLSYLPPERLADKLGSIGRGLPSTRLEVLRPDGRPVTPGSDETGEIVASGDNITLGYWKAPDETAKYFRNGKLHTGDLARVDADGFIFIVERARDMIKSSGNRVSAKEVEEVIAELPQVVEVAVLGVPDALLGETITACVVLDGRGAIAPRDVQNHCKRRLSSFKVPHHVFVLARLPHNAAGKVLKSKLLDMASNRPQLTPADDDIASHQALSLRYR